jgi:histidyl-tRNA synthetase
MFRYEKPQKGRYRQFSQFDVEALGYEGPDVDAELIIMCARMWRALGISRLTLEINSLGTAESRTRYRETLVEYFSSVKSELDDDSIRRLEQNPLRILDSKNPDMQDIVAAAPVMIDFLDQESSEHYQELKSLLDAAGVAYTVNPRLVRGLDYYSRTVFEWVTDALGSQGAVCSGGRYDGLVEKLGGRPTPAVGWAMGIERLVALFETCGGEAPADDANVYIVAVGDGALEQAFAIAEALRDEVAGLKVELNMGGGSFKSQLKRADKSNAEYALILGEQEIADRRAGLKPLRSTEDQSSVAFDELPAMLAKLLEKA